ncbi:MULTISPECIES: hypothetical protein [Pseudobacillus]|uniref:hypothetical protein n=1 Tax=Pseudobacillus TaxID=108525 RepID=UPI003879B0F3
MNFFDIRAEEIERQFFRRYKRGLHFLTGNKKQNEIITVSASAIIVKSLKGKNRNKINRKNVRKAIAYLLFKRTGTRKDLEQFSNFNSALMGLLKMILIEIAKIHKTVKGKLRITIKGVRFFFSGLDRSGREDKDSIIEGGAKFILCSYFYLREKGVKALHRLFEFIKENNLYLLIDSGEYSRFKASQKGKVLTPIKPLDYGNFIKKYKEFLWGYMNLDVTGDPIQSKENFDWLKEHTQISPIPVWHCDTKDWRKSRWDALEQMIEEDHELIAIGGTVHLGKNIGVYRQNEVKDRLFHEIFTRFPDQNFHWLGGSSSILLKYPFVSADSSGWLEGRKSRQIYNFHDNDIFTEKKTGWESKECLVHNVRVLSSLERIHEQEGIQLSLNISEEYALTKRNIQLSLF